MDEEELKRIRENEGDYRNNESLKDIQRTIDVVLNQQLVNLKVLEYIRTTITSIMLFVAGTSLLLVVLEFMK